MREYRSIKEPAEAEQEIKKSRFIGRLYPVSSLEEAQVLIDGFKKKYADASHHCSAMVVGEMGEFTRCSDDGEPSGTAGVPMLEVLKKSGLTNLLAVVTRYFGGTLLGAGGLVRAYAGSVAEVLRQAKQIRFMPSEIYRLVLPFKIWNKAEAQLSAAGFLIEEKEFTSDVTIRLSGPLGSGGRLRQLMAELSAGSIEPVAVGTKYSIVDL